MMTQGLKSFAFQSLFCFSVPFQSFLLQLICGLGIVNGRPANFEYGIASIEAGSFHLHPIWVQLTVTQAEDSK